MFWGGEVPLETLHQGVEYPVVPFHKDLHEILERNEFVKVRVGNTEPRVGAAVRLEVLGLRPCGDGTENRLEEPSDAMRLRLGAREYQG